MKPLDLNKVTKYVEGNIGSFHSTKLEGLEKLKLAKILKRKNPYLFKAKNILTAHDLVKSLLDAHISSQEETLFGAFLEKLAIFICQEVYDGRKSSTEGIDLEFQKDDIQFLVSIKSGPNWGNSSQINKMVDYFNKAKKTLRTQNEKVNVDTVNGCCYGKDNKPIKEKGYRKLCGQRFWQFISGNQNLYVDIIEPLGYQAKQKNDEFNREYSKIINLFTEEFMKDFCDNGVINWEKLVEFNSSK